MANKKDKFIETSLANNVPKFSGHEHENVEFFLEQIDSIARLEKWSDEKKLLIIKLNCQDKALQFISCDPVACRAKTTIALQDILREKFKKHVSFSQLQKEFSNINQTPKKSVEDIVQKIEQCGNAYLDINDQSSEEIVNLSKKIKLNKLLEALRPDIKIEVKKQNPKNFEEAVKIAKNIESVFDDVTCQSNNIQSSEIMTLYQSQVEANKKIGELTKQIEELKNNAIINNVQVQSENKDNKILCCLICGKNHLTINCWHFPSVQRYNDRENLNSNMRSHNQFQERQDNYQNNGQNSNARQFYSRNRQYRNRNHYNISRGNRYNRAHPYRRNLNS